MKNLFEHERDKYNSIHKYTGIEKNQIGYGRQLNLLTTACDPFHKKWQALSKEGVSFLEVGLGAGEIIKYFHEYGIEYCGIDISDWVVNELAKIGLNTKQMSAHQLSFNDNSFDVVQHLDGMEHIPVDWELNTLKEELRVCKQYIFHSNALGDAYLDVISKQKGFDELHINIKNAQQWDDFYQSNTILVYDIILKDISDDTYRIILKKNIKNEN